MNEHERIERILKSLKKNSGNNLDELNIIRAPGRINLVGGHTDYNNGFVLPCSIDKDIIIGAYPSDDKVAIFESLNFNKKCSFQINNQDKVDDQWINYIKGIINEYKNDGLEINGIRGAIHGTIPMGSGMGSSGAYEIAIALILKYLNKIDISNIELVKKCFHAERDFLNIETGIMDQFTSLFGKKDSLLFIDCRSLEIEIIKIPSNEIKLLVINSNVKRAAKEALNQRKAECAKAINILKNIGIEIQSLRDLDIEVFNKYYNKLPKIIAKRVKHIIFENHRVLKAKKALKNGDLEIVGECMKESHISLRDDYEVSCKELDNLFEILKSYKGVYGIRMTGAGFGGCVVALINRNNEKSIIEEVKRKYSRISGKKPIIYSCQISNGASKYNSNIH